MAIAPVGASELPGDLGARTAAVGEASASAADFEAYLDRLMLAESGGRDFARNPRSTALGPFQFVRSTFLSVARRHLAAEIEGRDEAAILMLRTDRVVARRAAAAYTRENAAALAAAGVATTYGNLRLAFLLGPSGAIRVLVAEPAAPLARLLTPAALRANPFMSGMTSGDLRARAEREISLDPEKRLVADPSFAAQASGNRAAPSFAVRCDRSLASCRRWVALKSRSVRAAGAVRRAAR